MSETDKTTEKTTGVIDDTTKNTGTTGTVGASGKEYTVDYHDLETASGNAEEFHKSLEETRKNIYDASQKICVSDVFEGPLADSCSDALTLLNKRVGLAVDNFSTIQKYFTEIADDYKKNDKTAALKVIYCDENGSVKVTTANPNAIIDANTGWVWPLGKGEKWVLTSHNDGGHHGIDIATYQKEGAPIYSALGGTVLASGANQYGYGNWVKVRLDNGLIAIYGHMSNSQPVVQPGDKIVAGQMIGKVGNTGNSTGPHIHFELRNANDTGSLDPLAYYPGLKSA